ncbi:hypothetical protein [Pseudomonas sp. H9]|uniref:hypothetical protein n=1 Tax=Pseudomonas sp. H9 TaxID=483968 RepID=UPI0010581D59|nr:hypothetical protein [Pseudomonas sp. H9]TDF86186.1 hypothetical protein E1573_01045 [Pseudomonas sp. H9]
MSMKKLTLAALFAAALAGCGGSKDKAEELIEVSDLGKHYGTIVEIASAGYARQYPMLDREQIRNVIRDKVDQDDLKNQMAEIYADHFDDDELDLMIQANKHPEQTMAIILGSKEGRALAEKVMEVQTTVAQDMQEAMADSEADIIDALDDLKDELKG